MAKKTQFVRIKEVLKEKGKTQVWLAGAIDSDVVSVSRWVKGHREPSLEVLYKIAKALKVDPCDLLNR